MDMNMICNCGYRGNQFTIGNREEYEYTYIFAICPVCKDTYDLDVSILTNIQGDN